MDLYIYIYIYTGHACRHLPSAVPWISEDRLLVLNTRSVCLCAAYINPFDSPHREHLGVDNTYFFDTIEGILLDTVNTVDGCEIILRGAFNARTADRS